MRIKLKYALPVAQMALAVVLHWLSRRWDLAVTADMPGTDMYFALCAAINAPVAVLRALVFLPGYWDPVLFVLAIGLQWYWASLNLESWRQRRTLVMFRWPPLRLAGDLLILAIGAFLAFISADQAAAYLQGRSGPIHFSPYLLSSWQILAGQVIIETCFVGWSLLLISLFGRDLVTCLRPARTHAVDRQV